MTDPSYRRVINEGLWNNNPALVQILGLCPLLAVSNTVINSLGLGLATTLTLVTSNAAVSLIRRWVRPDIRIPVFVLIIASVVTVIELAMNAWFHELYLILGIFIPLIVTNCTIIARAETFASKNGVIPSVIDGLFMGIGFMAVLVVLGAMRELVGFGTLLAHADLMFGEIGKSMTLQPWEQYRGYLLAILPPGAFMGLGFIMGGFCPGTSICAAAIGKIDALVYVGGILIGIFLFSELFSRFEPWYDGGFMGYMTIMEAFEISPYVFVFAFTLLAVLAFIIADIVRKRVKKVVY